MDSANAAHCSSSSTYRYKPAESRNGDVVRPTHLRRSGAQLPPALPVGQVGQGPYSPSRVPPFALGWPVSENGPLPGLQIAPVARCKLQMALVFQVPCVLWFSPMVQQLIQAPALPINAQEQDGVAIGHIGADHEKDIGLIEILVGTGDIWPDTYNEIASGP